LNTVPDNGALNVCRNPLIQMEFNREIIADSATGKITLSESIPAGGCPVGTTSFSRGWRGLLEKVASFFRKIFALVGVRPAVAAATSCAAPVYGSGSNRATSGTASSILLPPSRFKSALDANTLYTVTLDRPLNRLKAFPWR